MKVILTQDVSNLGVLGDEVTVKPGYARNFLIPQGKALLPTSIRSRELQHHRRQLDKLRLAAIEKANDEAKKVRALSLEIQKKAGHNGRLFGSVTNRDLEELFISLGFNVLRRSILIPEPIKQVGNHTISVKLHTSVKIDLQIKVIGDTTDVPMESQVTAPVASAEPQDEDDSAEE